MKNIIIVLILLILAGCNQTKEDTTPKYQVVGSPSDSAYRLNVQTGEVWEISPNGLKRIEEKRDVTLIIGNFYKTENGKTLKYLGNGKFENWQPKTAEEFLEKYK